MNKLPNIYSYLRPKPEVGLLIVWLICMVWSFEFLLSLTMIVLVVLAILYRNRTPELKSIFTSTAWLAPTIPFFLVLVTLIYSEDLNYTLERMRIKLPLLIFPFVFYKLPPLKSKDLLVLGYALITIAVISSFQVLGLYLSDVGLINESVESGKSLPTPSNHIRYSMVVALSIIVSVYIYLNNLYINNKYETRFILLAGIYLFVFSHILSVRSGLATLYSGLFLVLFIEIIRRKAWLWSLILPIVMGSILVAAVSFIPSLHAKYKYMLYDLQEYQNGGGYYYSDSERLFSLQAGYDVFKKAPLIGIGAGDVKKEVYAAYDRLGLNIANKKLPHSQLMSVAVGTGLIGLSLFLLAFWMPVFKIGIFHSALYTAFHVTIFISFLVENTIENNYGVSWFAWGLFIGMNYYLHPLNAHNQSLTKKDLLT